MDLIERYVAAIARHLTVSEERRRDIAAEIREELRSRLEADEGLLGRPLREGEVVELLRRHGHPWIIASRYWKRQYLIGPKLLPIYLYVLRAVLLWFLLPAFVAIALPAAVLTSSHPGAAAWGALLQLPWILFSAAAVVTAVFVVIESAPIPDGTKGLPFLGWDPRRLPGPGPQTTPVARSAAEIAWALLLAALWLDWIRPRWLGAHSTAAKLWSGSAVWSGLRGPAYWLVLALLLGVAALALVNWARPWWARAALAGAAAVRWFGAAMLTAVLLRAWPAARAEWLAVTAAPPRLAPAAQWAAWLDLSLAVAMTVTAIVLFIRGAQAGYEWASWPRRQPVSPPVAAGSERLW